MVRHAHAEWVSDEARPLSVEGERDAEKVARLLVPLAPEAIYSSPYPRSVQTVEPLARALDLEVQIIDALHERTLAQGAVADFDAALRDSWADLDFSFPTGESSRAATDRFASGVDDVRSRPDEGRVVIGTHGNVLALWLYRIDPELGYDFWRAMTWPDIYRVVFEAEEVVAIERLWPGETA